MSGLSSDLIPWAVFGASVVGSVHCVGMCGGLLMASSPTPAAVARYHLGRLVGYLALGGLAGALGGVSVMSGWSWVSWLATGLIALSFFRLGTSLWRGRALHVRLVPERWVRWGFCVARGRSFAVGLLSALLPCGWLHGFVLAALAVQSPVRGALVLAVFWLGTLPAMTSAPWVVGRVLLPLSRALPRVSALLLISAGLLTLGARYWGGHRAGRGAVEGFGHGDLICVPGKTATLRNF